MSRSRVATAHVEPIINGGPSASARRITSVPYPNGHKRKHTGARSVFDLYDLSDARHVYERQNRHPARSLPCRTSFCMSVTATTTTREHRTLTDDGRCPRSIQPRTPADTSAADPVAETR